MGWGEAQDPESIQQEGLYDWVQTSQSETAPTVVTDKEEGLKSRLEEETSRMLEKQMKKEKEKKEKEQEGTETPAPAFKFKKKGKISSEESKELSRTHKDLMSW